MSFGTTRRPRRPRTPHHQQLRSTLQRFLSQAEPAGEPGGDRCADVFEASMLMHFVCAQARDRRVSQVTREAAEAQIPFAEEELWTALERLLDIPQVADRRSITSSDFGREEH